ncbi:hypothetical protein ASPACDRAFT_1870878 [Aspergillus aculeatus ATCC 16872]|uniref:Amine oxidase n=1 Tax=Aspergillus aculeatus (strain ATCC 16872 / CBS 172.66 / WB 5094) TaxID=690307 RepID=A0A1L9WR01_ASPA1|nr:uncharacterized protein ASPACDRAFT_1870878 [Aspergillus aculeatus ATCC 16872]OJJ98609.1 hypothetical protein ASPACDRAFT_1870878 [Aspergillus aculeatus ATCC 16872]
MSRSKEGFLWTPTETTSGLPTNAVQSSSPTLRDRYDVIVIGAGFAGLTAARDLSQKHGLAVLLVEARDRIGGRTWTARVLGEEIEMGGTWVHWNQPHLYAELHRYGLHLNLKSSAGAYAPHEQLFKSSGGVVEKVSSEHYGPALERVAQRVFAIEGLDSRALMPYPHDPLRAPSPWKRYDHLSVQDRLDQLTDLDQWEKELFASNISTFGSAPAKETGFTDALRWFALGGHSMAGVFELAGNYKLGRGGMTSLARAILSEYVGDISFGTVVAEVNHEADEVEVRTKDGRRFRADAVISTIPLNCLSDVQFNPPLSQPHQTAVRQGHINRGAKIHFKLRETLPGWFWTANEASDSEFVFAFSDHNGTQPSGPSGTWCIGFGYNGQLTQKTDSEHIVQRFKRDIKPDVTVEAYATHDWMNDPYAKGVWACWGPNSASAHLQELQKPHGRILFASADWADGWRGFIDGAIERGQVAVRDTVRLLKETSTVSAKL